MSPFILFAVFLSLFVGTAITFASSHWLLAWMGLEINTLAVIPLMTRPHHPRAVEAALKYFLIQATAAALVLFAATSNAWLTGEWGIMHLSDPLSNTLLILALALKIGLAPTHFWLPEVLQGLDLLTGLIVSTWQKLAPFILMLQVTPGAPALTFSLGVVSLLIGGWGGLNQTQLRKLLAYSSIAHLGWMILVMHFSPALAILSLFLYIVMTSSVFLMLTLNKSTTVNALSTSWAKSPALMALTPLTLLSLAGLPPLSGFMPKWFILQELAKQGVPATATIAALSALLSLYFYLRISYTMSLTIPPNTATAPIPWRLSSLQSFFPVSLLTVAAITLLPLAPSILALLDPL
nr:NADH dehydrogenase subunit 2 [Bathypterois atricolor]